MDGESLRKAFELAGFRYRGTNFNGSNVSIACPFAGLTEKGMTHSRGFDRNPSCSIRVDPIEPSVFFCHTCKEKGTFVGMINRLETLGELPTHIVEKIERLEQARPDLLMEPPKIETPGWLKESKGVSWDSVPRYILERGVSKASCRKWHLGYDRKRNRCVFPLWDVWGTGVGMVGRVLRDKAKGPKYPAYPGTKKSDHLYGLHLARKLPGPRTLILVEGMLDVILPTQDGIEGIVACMGTYISKRQRTLLRTFADEVVILFDDDDAGAKGVDDAVDLLGGFVPIRVGSYPKGVHDPKDLYPEEFREVVKLAEAA